MSLILSGTDGISDVDGSASTPALRGTDANTGIFFPAADTIAFSEGGVESMRIDSSGNVGIGRTSPAAVFGGSGGLDAAGYLIARGAINAHQTSAGVFQYSGNETTIRSYGATAGTGAIVFNTGGGGGSADTERMRIDSAGNVGIGTASPSTRLAINDPGTGLGFTNAASGNFNLGLLGGTGSAEAFIYNRANAALIFGTNNTERMRITSGGNVGIGTTSPSYTLDVRATSGTISATSTTGTNSSYVAANNTGGITLIGRDSSSGGLTGTAYANLLYGDGSYPIIFSTNGTARMRINADAPILCLAGGNTSATGTGIAFPATQSASSDANTLDDYEEGTWTPTLGDGSVSVNGAGFYTKIGRLVYLVFEFENVSRPSGVNTAQTIVMGGLPFSTGNEGVRSPRNYPIGLFVNIGGTNLGAYGGYSWRTITDTTMRFQMANSATNLDVQSPTWSQMPTTGSGGMYIRGYLVYNAT